jgi:hypothetical protein
VLYKLPIARGVLGLSYIATIILLQLYFPYPRFSGLLGLQSFGSWASRLLQITWVLYSACLFGIPMSPTICKDRCLIKEEKRLNCKVKKIDKDLKKMKKGPWPKTTASASLPPRPSPPMVSLHLLVRHAGLRPCHRGRPRPVRARAGRHRLGRYVGGEGCAVGERIFPACAMAGVEPFLASALEVPGWAR